MLGDDTTKRKADGDEALHAFAAAAVDSARPVIFIVGHDEHWVDDTARLLRAESYTVETFGTGAGFLNRQRRFGPACLILDAKLPDMEGIDVQAALLEAGDDTPVIFVADVPEVATTVTAIKRGALDYLVQPVSPEILTERIRFAVEHHRGRLKNMIQRRELMLRFGRLTSREREVATLVATGMPNKEIAAHLGTAEKTVKHHRARMMLKLGVESVAQLVRLLDRIGAASNR